jgi:hypothetical protein
VVVVVVGGTVVGVLVVGVGALVVAVGALVVGVDACVAGTLEVGVLEAPAFGVPVGGVLPEGLGPVDAPGLGDAPGTPVELDDGKPERVVGDWAPGVTNPAALGVAC